jgi:hypothetical protein
VVVPHGIDPVLPPGPASGGFTPPSEGAPLLLPPLLLVEPDELPPLLEPLDVDPELDPEEVDPEVLPELLDAVASPPSESSVAGLPFEPPQPTHAPIPQPATPSTRQTRQCTFFGMVIKVPLLALKVARICGARDAPASDALRLLNR